MPNNITIKKCEDCREDFEQIQKETRCLNCQTQLRITGMTAHQRYIESLKSQAIERTRREAAKDKRPSSIAAALSGVVTLSNGVKVEYTSTNRI